LAAAAVLATLCEMEVSDVPEKVGKIQEAIRSSLKDLGKAGVSLRGKGALWVLEFPTSARVKDVMSRILRGGVMVSPTANFIRLLPGATITSAHLTEACGIIREACEATSSSSR
jgi:acetylornithine/succinyldiaminopimelate/putrescine aminotransferase